MDRYQQKKKVFYPAMKKSSTRSQITINTTEKRLLSITKKKLIKDKNHRHDKKKPFTWKKV